jgi:hypothetical protein
MNSNGKFYNYINRILIMESLDNTNLNNYIWFLSDYVEFGEV